MTINKCTSKDAREKGKFPTVWSGHYKFLEMGIAVFCHRKLTAYR